MTSDITMPRLHIGQTLTEGNKEMSVVEINRFYKDMSALDKRLHRHALWCEGESGGEKISLINEDLSHQSLFNLNLRHVDMSGANLTNADLRGADLTNACMSGCDLRGANLDGVKGKQIYQFFFGKDYGYYVDGELTLGERSHPIEYWAVHSLRILKEMKYPGDQIPLHHTIIQFIADTKA